jgi:hypothetical protein
MGRSWVTRGLALAVLMAAGAVVPAAESDLHFATTDGSPIRWQDWLDANAPVAVLVLASWVPEGGRTVDSVGSIATTARAEGLSFVIISVQEPFDDAKEMFQTAGVTWFHDRHGAILKEYRIIKLPRIVVVDSTGEVLAQLEPTEEALRSWNP